jgi:hypothetical protein
MPDHIYEVRRSLESKNRVLLKRKELKDGKTKAKYLGVYGKDRGPALSTGASRMGSKRISPKLALSCISHIRVPISLKLLLPHQLF